jgi:hypothetical protein
MKTSSSAINSLALYGNTHDLLYEENVKNELFGGKVSNKRPHKCNVSAERIGLVYIVSILEVCKATRLRVSLERLPIQIKLSP